MKTLLRWCVGVLLVSVTACSTDAAGSGGRDGEPGAATLPGTAGERDGTPASASMVLPVEAYLRTWDQAKAISRAAGLLERDCMARFGFDYRPPQEFLTQPESFIARRYGYVYDQATAEKWGYHPPATGDTDEGSGTSGVERVVLTGRDPITLQPVAQTSTGLVVPDGGCKGEARARILKDGGFLGHPDPVREVNLGSFPKSMEDPRVRAVFASWSECMAEQGYTVEDPLFDTMPDGITLDTPAPSQKEITMALWDVECQQRTGVVRTWFQVESEIQMQMIEENAEALAQVRRDNEAMVRNAADVIEELGG